MKEISQAVIFAGGVGERLKPFTETEPKPMYRFRNKPFLEYLICQVREWGITDIVLLLGYLSEKVTEYFGDGSFLGVNIEYVITPVEYETQYRLKAAIDILRDEFLMLYCDNICPIDFKRLRQEYEANNALVQFTAYANEDGYTKSNLRIANDGKVELYDKKRITPGLKGVDIGYAVVSKKIFSLMSSSNDNFEAVVYPRLVEKSKLYATVTKHRYYSIGSFSRIELTKKYLSGQKYIFLDRDGVVNRRPPKAEYICRPMDFVWIEGARTAIKRLNDAGYFIIMISNQAGIARGILTHDDFHAIQKRMDLDLKKINAHIDAVYYCPHGWDEGCGCRKPEPGMLYQAQKDFSINLTECILIGDDERDIMAAHNADMRSVLVTGDYTLLDAVDDILAGEITDFEVEK